MRCLSSSHASTSFLGPPFEDSQASKSSYVPQDRLYRQIVVSDHEMPHRNDGEFHVKLSEQIRREHRALVKSRKQSWPLIYDVAVVHDHTRSRRQGEDRSIRADLYTSSSSSYVQLSKVHALGKGLTYNHYHIDLKCLDFVLDLH